MQSFFAQIDGSLPYSLSLTLHVAAVLLKARPRPSHPPPCLSTLQKT